MSINFFKSFKYFYLFMFIFLCMQYDSWIWCCSLQWVFFSCFSFSFRSCVKSSLTGAVRWKKVLHTLFNPKNRWFVSLRLFWVIESSESGRLFAAREESVADMHCTLIYQHFKFTLQFFPSRTINTFKEMMDWRKRAQN